jgi:hypothetical protein
MRDLLRFVVLVDDEVVLPQAGDESAVRVGDRRGDVDQLDAALEAERFLTVTRTLGALRLSLRGHDSQRGEQRSAQGDAESETHGGHLRASAGSRRSTCGTNAIVGPEADAVPADIRRRRHADDEPRFAARHERRRFHSGAAARQKAAVAIE